MRHSIDDLEKRVHAYRRDLELLRERDRTEELLAIIKKPGWTTPAEFVMVTALVEEATHLAQALSVLNERIFEGAQAVTMKG